MSSVKQIQISKAKAAEKIKTKLVAEKETKKTSKAAEKTKQTGKGAAKKTAEKKQPKLSVECAKFFTVLTSYLSDFVDEETWDEDAFKTVFTAHLPASLNPKKAKKAKDPNAPKKVHSAYIEFSKDADVRSRIKEEHPEATQNEMMTYIGQLWNSAEYKTYCDDGEFTDKQGRKYNYTRKAQKFVKRAAEDKERYDAEMADYTPPEGEKKKLKKPMNAFMFYCADETVKAKAKEELEDTFTGKELHSEMTKLMGTWWNKLKKYTDEGSQKDKQGKFEYTKKAQPFLEKAEKAKEAYKEAKAESEESEKEAEKEESKKKSVKKSAEKKTPKKGKTLVVEEEEESEAEKEEEEEEAEEEEEIEAEEEEIEAEEEEIEAEEEEQPKKRASQKSEKEPSKLPHFIEKTPKKKEGPTEEEIAKLVDQALVNSKSRSKLEEEDEETQEALEEEEAEESEEEEEEEKPKKRKSGKQEEGCSFTYTRASKSAGKKAGERCNAEVTKNGCCSAHQKGK